MFPLLYIGSYPVYIFGIFLGIALVVFLFMLGKISKKYNISLAIFTNNILWYILSVFIFSRLFYVISRWNDLQYMDSFSDFFATTDYNFSLFGAMFGFVIVFLINLKLRGERAIKYLDTVVLSFLLALVIGQIGALLGGQVIGNPTNYGIEIAYTNEFSPVTSTPIFPLAIVYAVLFFIEFAVLYSLTMYIKVKGFIAYIGLIAFSLIIFIFENFSGRHDMFDNYFFLNMNQILAFGLMIFSFYRLYYLSKISSKDTSIILEHK